MGLSSLFGSIHHVTCAVARKAKLIRSSDPFVPAVSSEASDPNHWIEDAAGGTLLNTKGS
jgi:hypothetical protein